MVSVAAGVVTLLAAGCFSALLMSTRIDDRATNRALSPSASSDEVAFERSALFDETADGDQIYVYWWRAIDPTATVEGVGSNPPTGSWWVSPELQRRMLTDRDLRGRYPNARPIGRDGVAHPGELLAYRFVGPGITLNERLSTRPGTDWIGDGAEVVDPFPIAMAALALVGLPGLGLLVASLSPAGAAIDRRRDLLMALGARTRTRRGVLVAHAVLCSAPGAVLAAGIWVVASRRLHSVPFVGRRVFAGDLAVPLGSALSIALATVVLTILVAMVRPRFAAGNRPAEHTPRSPTLVRALPLVAGVALAFAGTVTPGKPGAKLFLVGVVASSIGAVVAMPYLLDRAGASLSRRSGVLPLLVGRRLSWGAVSSTRSLLAVGVLAVLVPVISSWVEVARSLDPRPSGDSYVVELRGQLAASDARELADGTGAVSLALVSQYDPDGLESFSLVGDCGRLGDLVALETCGPSGFTVDGPGPLAPFAGLPGLPQAPPDSDVRSSLFLSRDSQSLEHELRRFVVNGDHPDLQVASPGREVFHESPLVAWILGAAKLSALVAGLALTLHLVGQSSRLARSRSRLLALGADVAVSRRLAAGESGLCVAIVGLGCALLGAVDSWMFVQIDPTASMPMLALVLVVLVVLLLAAVAGTAAGLVIPAEPKPTAEYLI